MATIRQYTYLLTYAASHVYSTAFTDS